MRKKLLFLIITLFVTHQGFTQKPTDGELNRLINTISTLRHANQKDWRKAYETFKNDKLWTVMDEIPRHANEYYLIGDNQFKLNPLLNQCRGDNKQMTPGDFLNGNDPQFDYSLTEIGIKQKSSVSYELKYRAGRQFFIVMPYDKDKTKKIELNASLNGTQIAKGKVEDDGNIYLLIDQAVSPTDVIRIDIKNDSDTKMPIVLINHNTKNKQNIKQ
jgi:hypothetical protein